MTRTVKGLATLALAIGAAAGTGQSATFAVANDSHTPVIVADPSVGSASAGELGEGHAPAPQPNGPASVVQDNYPGSPMPV